MLPKIHLQLFEPQEEQSPTVARILRQRMVSQHLSQFLEVVAVSQVFRYHDLDWHLRLLHSPAHQQWKQDTLLLVHMLFEFVPDVLEELDQTGGIRRFVAVSALNSPRQLEYFRQVPAMQLMVVTDDVFEQIRGWCRRPVPWLDLVPSQLDFDLFDDRPAIDALFDAGLFQRSAAATTEVKSVSGKHAHRHRVGAGEVAQAADGEALAELGVRVGPGC